MISRRCKYRARPPEKLSTNDVTSLISPISTLEVFRHGLLKFFVTMSRSESSTDPRYRRAVRELKEHPTLKLPSAMWLARFTEEECKDRTIQMRVRRLISSNIDSTLASILPASVSVDPNYTPATNFSSVSSLTADKFTADSLSQTILFPPDEQLWSL